MDSARLTALRTRLWHLRNGGLTELLEHDRRLGSEGVGMAGGVRAPSTGSRLTRLRDLVGRRGLAKNIPDWPCADAGCYMPRHKVKAAVILDKFSEMAFGYEWYQVLVTPEQWNEQLATNDVDLLFVESAWHGNDDAWQYQLTGSRAPSDALRALVDHCQKNGIPTVFWNKEDPAHFDDFIATAALFDYVYTTDVNKVPDYVERLGHDRIGVLPFAAQQSIHNPVRLRGWSEAKLRGAAFAGTYFRDKYPERRQQMDELIGGTIRAVEKTRASFDIFSRFIGVNPNYEFPEKWKQHVQGELTYTQMLTAYRSYKTFLNVNSVVGSPSMCARRIFEITACGTPVVSAPSEAIDLFFPEGGVLQAGSEPAAYDTVRALLRSPELRDRLVAVGQRQIWLNHTYTKRVDQVLGDVGLGDRKYVRPTVSALISTNRPGQVGHALKMMSQQEEVDLEVLILCHGFEVQAEDREKFEDQFGPIKWLSADPSVPLGECYNILAKAATGDVVAKIDDDDLYGPYYLFESLMAMDYAGADIVGKAAHYMFLEDMDATVLRFPETENKYRDFVSGPTIVAKRSVVLANPFPQVSRGEDTGFLRAARDAGAVTYSAGRFGFMQVRSSKGHTWSIEDQEILATADVVTYGQATEHVLF